MEEDLEELKEKISKFINNYDITDFTIYINESVNGKKIITLGIEV